MIKKVGELTGFERNLGEAPTLQGLLPFFRPENDRPHRVLIAKPMRVFKPRGLMLWDVGRETINMLLVGRDLELVCDFRSIPARWFTTAQNFAAVARAVAEGVDPPAWGDWHTAWPGYDIRIEFDGPVPEAQALMWGEYT